MRSLHSINKKFRSHRIYRYHSGLTFGLSPSLNLFSSMLFSSHSVRTHSYSLFTLHLWLAYSSHIFHHRFTKCIANKQTHAHLLTYTLTNYMRWLYPSRFDDFSLLYESVSCVLSYSISIARFLSFFYIFFYVYQYVCSVYAFSSSLSCRCFSYFIFCLCCRAEKSNSNGDFMLKVTLFCQKWFYFILFFLWCITNDWPEIAAATVTAE